MPTGNENNINGGLFFFNKETGEWTPCSSVESIGFEITLSEDAEATLASVFEPLGDLEIVPNPEKPGDSGKPGKDGGDGDDS